MRRKYQKTGNSYINFTNILTIKIQKRIIKAKNKTWRQKHANIKNIDPTLWQTYKIIGGIKTRIPVLQDTTHNIIHYTDKKSPRVYTQFRQVHLNDYHTYSALHQQIEHKVTLILETCPTQEISLSCSPRAIKEIIKKLPNNKPPVRTK